MVLSSKRFTIYSRGDYLICPIFDIWNDYFKIPLELFCLSSEAVYQFYPCEQNSSGRRSRASERERESMHLIIKIINDGKHILNAWTNEDWQFLLKPPAHSCSHQTLLTSLGHTTQHTGTELWDMKNWIRSQETFINQKNLGALGGHGFIN